MIAGKTDVKGNRPSATEENRGNETLTANGGNTDKNVFKIGLGETADEGQQNCGKVEPSRQLKEHAHAAVAGEKFADTTLEKDR